eukprot:6256396-Pyramimonas_sp.AAC.1
MLKIKIFDKFSPIVILPPASCTVGAMRSALFVCIAESQTRSGIVAGSVKELMDSWEDSGGRRLRRS